MQKSIRALIGAGIIFLPAFCFAQSNQTESLTITTYYPSPYGVYRNLKFNPSEVPTAGVTEGVMYYDRNYHLLRYYDNNNQWVNVTGGGGGGTDAFWNETANNINNTNLGMVYIKGKPDANGVLMEVRGNLALAEPGEGSVFYLRRRFTVAGSKQSSISFVSEGRKDYQIQHVQNPPILRIVKGPPGGIALAVNADRVGIGTENPIAPLQVETGALTSPLMVRNGMGSTDQSGIASLTPYKNAVHLAYGCYLKNDTWIHDPYLYEGSENVYNARFTVQPNVGVKWSASNTKSCSWNLANNVRLWNQAGTWISNVQLPDGDPGSSPCEPGRIKYHGGHFWGCKPDELWHPLDPYP